jgi:ADP-heptose:LPS heptosyltransferase
MRPIDLLVNLWPAPKRRCGALVVRLFGIGDAVLFRGAMERLAHVLQVPSEQVVILGADAWAGAAPLLYAPYTVVGLDQRRFERSPLYRLRMGLWLKRQGFAVAVCAMHYRKAMIADSAVLMTGAPRRVVAIPHVGEKVRQEVEWYLRQMTQVIDTGPEPTHELVRLATFLSALSGRPEPPRLACLTAPGVNEPPFPKGSYVAFNVGASEPGRRWPAARFVELARMVRAEGYPVVILGGPSEKSQAHEVGKCFADDPKVRNLAGRTSMAQVLDHIANAAAMVANDTGPAHLAVSLGVQTVIIAGLGQWGAFVPYPEAFAAQVETIHLDMPCKQCDWRCQFPRKDGTAFKCVADIPTEAVMEALRRRLGSRKCG